MVALGGGKFDVYFLEGPDFVIKGDDKPKSVNLQNHGNPVVYRNIWMVPAGSERESK